MDRIEEIALAVVARAGEPLRRAWRQSKRVAFKGVVDLVTETDREIEAMITADLRDAFPDHVVVGEEASSTPGATSSSSAASVWYLDPIDGTTNFAHGHPHFAVSLAFARGGELELGIVHDPVRGETFRARRGAGATLNGVPLAVSVEAELDRALVGTGFPYDRRENVAFHTNFVGAFLAAAQGVRCSGSAALDLAYVACGRLDAFWEWKLKPWDTAAGVLLVKEAGGRVSDFRGAEFDLRGSQTLASNGRLHAALLRVLGARLAGGA